MKRPTENSLDNVEVARRFVEKHLMAWIEEDEDGISGYIEDIADAVDHCISMDAYEIASYLDSSHGWACDKELVDILDDLGWFVRFEVEAAVALWVTGESIKPKYSMGDIVNIKDRDKDMIGEIVKIDTKTAKYHVFIESL